MRSQTILVTADIGTARIAPQDKFSGADEGLLTAIAERERLLHTLGNLTLVTTPLNPALRNREFEFKRSVNILGVGVSKAGRVFISNLNCTPYSDGSSKSSSAYGCNGILCSELQRTDLRLY